MSERIVTDANSQKKKDFDDLMAGKIKFIPKMQVQVAEVKPAAKKKVAVPKQKK